MKKKGLISAMPPHVLQTVEKIRGGFQLGSHVNVTQLGRSTAWRSHLAELGAMQVLDRNQTTAVLLTPDAFLALTEYIDLMEKELEKAQVETLLAERADMNNRESGEELARKAKESFLSRQEHLQRLLHDDQE